MLFLSSVLSILAVVPGDVSADGGRGGDQPELTLTTDKSTSVSGETVTATATYSGDQTNIDFEVTYTNGTTMLTKSVPTSGGQQPDDYGLVGSWSFDEGEGGTTYDRSGNGNDGSLENGILWTSGVSGSALLFDGEDDYVDILDDDALDLTSEYTVSAWVKPHFYASSNYLTVLSKGSNDYGSGYELTTEQDSKFCFTGSDSGTNTDVVTSTNAWQPNQWYFVVVTRNAMNFSIFVDGEDDLGSKVADGLLSANDLNLQIGKNWQTVNARKYFDGVIDEVKIYNRSFSSAEIGSLYHQHSWKVNQTIHWTFDEGIGQEAEDGSGNDNNGTIYGATWTEGVSGTALEFDGSIDDHISANHTAVDGLEDFTFSVWIYSTIVGNLNKYTFN